MQREHYVRLIAELYEPPVLIGHSFGGLIVELLLDRGLGRAGVALSPAPKRCAVPETGRILYEAGFANFSLHPPAQTDYLEFEGRPHLLVVGEGSEEVAAAIDSWLDGVLEAPVPAQASERQTPA
jgi:pimeloyl-ACP methyl ester carboxylesterase